MGFIRLLFKAKRRTKREVFTAIVDSDMELTSLNLETARKLGLDEANTPQATMEVPGGVNLVGYELTNVELSYGRRKATLPTVFVPVRAEKLNSRGRVLVSETIPVNEAQFIGRDFLHTAKAHLDYENHTLTGVKQPFFSLKMRPQIRPATPAERVRLRASTTCRVPKRKKRK